VPTLPEYIKEKFKLYKFSLYFTGEYFTPLWQKISSWAENGWKILKSHF